VHLIVNKSLKCPPTTSPHDLQCRTLIIPEWWVLSRRRKDTLSTNPSSAHPPHPCTTCNAVPPLFQSGESWVGEGKTHCHQILQVPTHHIPAPPAMPYPHYFRVVSPDEAKERHIVNKSFKCPPPHPCTTCNAVPPLFQSGESWWGKGKTHCQQILQVPTDHIPAPPEMPYPHYFRVVSPD
jgi:hypothetical protein